MSILPSQMPTYDPQVVARSDFAIEIDTVARQVAKEPQPAPRRRQFLHDVALTMGAEASVVASSLILTAIVSRWMGARPLSEYLLLRRVLSWSVAVTLLGLETGLPRYVAHAAGSLEREEPAYLVAGFLCTIPTAIAVAMIMIFNRAIFAYWLFGDLHESGLVIALALLLFGYSIHRCVYGYYRGLLDMTRANVQELANSAFLPLVVVLLLAHGQTVAFMMGLTGAVMALSAALFAWPALRRLRGASLELVARCRDLLRYGVPRVPGEFGAAAVTAIGPLLAVHFLRLARVSPLLIGLNMLLVIGYAAGPLGVVLLSKVSMMLAHGEHEAVRARLRLVLAGVVELSVFACFQLAVFADVIVRAWVGPGFEDQMNVVRLVLLTVPPYLFFMVLRSTIDAVSVKPYNTANVMISLATYVGLIVLYIRIMPSESLLTGIAASLLVSQSLLALLTARTFRHFYGLSIPWRQLAPSLLIAAALGGAALGLRQWQSGPMPVAEALGAECAMIGLYFAALTRLRSSWLSYSWRAVTLRAGGKGLSSAGGTQ